MSTDQSQQRSWSTKHLSATGRMNEQCIRSSQLIGAQVNDSAGNRIGQIQDTIVNPASGRIDFALLSLEQNGPASGSASGQSANNHLAPVPWSLLRSPASSAQYANSSERPTFTFNGDRSKLESAPKVDLSDLSQSEWRQRVYSYYGVTPPHASMGAAETPQGEIKGQGARELEQNGQNPTPNP